MKFEDISFRIINSDELQKLDYELQLGMEVLFSLVEMKDNLTNDDVLDGIARAMTAIDGQEIQFPLFECNNYRDLAVVLGFTLGEILREEYQWEWRQIDEYQNEYVGWVIVSPEKKIGIQTEDYFYQQILARKDIKFAQLCEKIKSRSIDKGETEFSFYMPWKNN